MEASINHETNAKPPPLTSDQLNYLIWRYLQESGYGEAAVKLQRDWKIDAESLPFAPRVKGQALISLVQKGLRYYHLHQTLDENGQASRTLNPELFFFGPHSERASSPGIARDVVIRPSMTYRPPSPDLPAYNGVRKHARESGPNGVSDPTSTQPATKRSRKSAYPATNNNADRNANNGNNPNMHQQQAQQQSTTDSDNNNGTAMDLGEREGPAVPIANGQHHQPRIAGAEMTEEPSAGSNGVKADTRMMDVDAPDPQPDAEALLGAAEAAAAGMGVGLGEPRDQAPEQQIIEPLPLISTLANGENIGVQVDPAKVAQLGPATTFLHAPGAESITHTSWHPANASLLTASGPTFCGLWGMSGTNNNAQQPLYKSVVDSAPDTLVTAVAWQPSGTVLAIATYAGQSGRIHIFDGRTLSLLTILPASQRAIVSLKWLPSGTQIVGLAASDDESTHGPSSTSLLLWDLSGDASILAPRPVTVQETLLDVDCISHPDGNVVCAAGDDVVYQCKATATFDVEERWEPSRSIPPTAWTFVRCTRATSSNKVSIVAASADSMHLWMPVQGVLLKAVHNGPITGLQMRPPPADGPNVLEFATSSVDGTIKAWRFSENLNLLSPLLKVTLGHLSPVMALSYSPDGFCFAGAGYDKLRIWNADQGYSQPLAVWDGSNSEWRGASLKEDDSMSNGGMSSLNGDHTSSSADHCLVWDGNSKKLAFSLNNQLAILDHQH